MPNTRLQKQKAKFRKYFINLGMHQSIRAMEVVDTYHTGSRRDGNPERSHLYEVAGQTLAFLEGRVTDYQLDCVVAASFLHDVVEDYSELYSPLALKAEFLPLTTDLVMNVCKREGFEKTPEDYATYFTQVQQHIFSVFIKVSDRIHNLATCIGGMTDKRIQAYIAETEEYFYPMLKKARKDYPEFYMTLTSMKQQLEYRTMMIRTILTRNEKAVAFMLPDDTFTTNPEAAAEQWADAFYVTRDALARIRPVPENLIRATPVRDLDEILAECDKALTLGK